MGEVYRARDTRLHRDVAIKILPQEWARDPDRLARFAREATTLASLNHPNITQIYGIEESATDQGAIHALVMELVEGEDLAHRLRRGRMPNDEALATVRQIVDALEAAHSVGVIHRDLKPANVKVRPDGITKVLDFGLAKLAPLGPDAETDANALTITASGATRPGIILGTPGYMAPEQAKGQPVDRRADIWALGCLMFEMVSGRTCFAGDTVSETIARVLEREPDWDALPADAPAGLRRLLRRCLQKDPKWRLHDVADARLEIDDIAADHGPGTGSAHQPAARNGWRPIAIGLLFVTGVLAALLMSGASIGPENRSVITARLTDIPGVQESPALSPDGKAVAFVSGVGKTKQILVQLLAGGPPLPLTHDTADHDYPRWSADAGSVIYFSPARSGETQGTIWEVPALGGQPRRLVDGISGADVSLTTDRLTLFRLGDGVIELITASRDGSNVDVLARFDPTMYYLYPRWSPDGRWIAFQRGDQLRADVFVVSGTGGDVRQVTRENNLISGFAWLPDSSGIVYSSSRGGTMPYLSTSRLWRVALGSDEVHQVTWDDTSYVQPDISRAGDLVAARLQLSGDIWSYPADGQARDNVRRGVQLTRQTGHVLTPTAAPGDTEIAFLSDRGGHANLWVVKAGSGEMRQITNERDPDVSVGVPVWSPDGKAIAFVSSRGNKGLTFGVWLVNPDGSGLRNLVNPGLGPAWSQDGRWVYYSTRGAGTGDEIVLRKIPADGGNAVTVTTEQSRNVVGSDGTTLYYVFERRLVDGTPEFEIRAANPEDGPFRVLARIPPTRVPTWQIVNPALSPNGQWLAQALTDGLTTNIWALSTTTGQWRQVTDFGDRRTVIARRVSWSSDGRSILAAVAEASADIVSITGLIQR